MKKIAFAFIVLFVAACSESSNKKLEASLKEKVTAAEGRELKDFKSEDLTFTDTVTVAKRIAEIEEDLRPYYIEKNLNGFVKMRNQEFKTFRNDPTYEKEIMRGRLKDASPWCTELRQVTEKADSLIANWDDVSQYDYDYIYLVTWYINRARQFYNNDSSTGALLQKLPEFKDELDERKELLSKPEDDVLFYRVRYTYSFFNDILGQRIGLSRTASVTSDLEVIDLSEAILK